MFPRFKTVHLNQGISESIKESLKQSMNVMNPDRLSLIKKKKNTKF